jgi:hypothetical protein
MPLLGLGRPVRVKFYKFCSGGDRKMLPGAPAPLDKSSHVLPLAKHNAIAPYCFLPRLRTQKERQKILHSLMFQENAS